MSDSTLVADRLLRIAMNASQESTVEEENFASVVASTRLNFRRNNGNRVSTPRGRKRKSVFSIAVVVMKLAHADFFPGKHELHFLRQRGLGLYDGKLELGRSMSCDIIKDFIIQFLHPNIQALLRMSDFKIGRTNKSRQIEIIEHFKNGEDLEMKLKQSKMIILPCNDFPNNLPLIENTNTVSTRASTSRNSRNRYDEDVDHSDRSSTSSPNVSRFVTRTSTLSSSLSNRRLQFVRSSPIVEELDEDDEDTDDNILTIDESNVNRDSLVVLPRISENADDVTVHISRNNCLTDLFKLYQDEQIVNKKLNVEFLGEMGIDGGGLTKELFNVFFQKCAEQYFRGQDSLVPYLELNKRNEIDKFIVIGRILRHMLLLTQTIPSKLSKITLMLISNLDRDINADILQRELLDYVNPYLRKLLKKAHKNFSHLTETEVEVIQDFYQAHRFYERPNADKIKDQLTLIATDIFVEKPNRLILKIRQGVSPEKNSEFWSNCDFHTLLDLQKPTPTKIVNCLQTDPHLTNDQSDVFHYFTMYIHCLDKDKLASLVFLITGSFMMPNIITVKFSDAIGLSQRPTFSTYTDTITLPETYASYDELQSDLNICLNLEEAKEYTSY